MTKVGNEKPNTAKAITSAIDPGAGLPRRDDAHRNGNAQCDEHRTDRQRQRRLDPLDDHLADGLVGEDRNAEIAADHVPEPCAELRKQRLVEAQLFANAFNVLARGLIARDDRGRIAGAEMQKREDENRHDQHDRNGGEDAANDNRRQCAGRSTDQRRTRRSVVRPRAALNRD